MLSHVYVDNKYLSIYNAVKSHVCTTVKRNIKKTWEKASKGKQWLEAVTRKVKWRNQQKETAQFRLETGHDLLAKHLHKLGITDSNKCTLCATEQHIRGHLQRCTELQNIRDALPKNMAEPEKASYLYWETRKRMWPNRSIVGIGRRRSLLHMIHNDNHSDIQKSYHVS
jgi:hypothetical protein